MAPMRAVAGAMGTSPRLASSFWGPSGRTLRQFMTLDSRFAALGFQLEGCRTRRPGPLLILARKRSGFAELFMNKRKDDNEFAYKTLRVLWPLPPVWSKKKLEDQKRWFSSSPGSARSLEEKRLGEQEKQADESGPQRPRLKRGKVSPRLDVPKLITRPPYVGSRRAPAFLDEFQIQDGEGIERMRASGKLAAQVRDFAGTLVKPGVTTDEIDRAVHQMIIDAGAYPSPLGYGGFPKSVCTSVNECICHGIPDSRPLQDGDIVNIDVTVFLNGYHGDTSKTFYCGNVSDDAKQLVEVTRESLDKAISICGPGVEFKKIGKTINEVADKYGYGVVEHFVGHGVGQVFHSAPSIVHNRNNQPGRMVVGQTFTIEPMLTQGSIRDVIWNDDWTCVTEDGGLSAQFEHSLLITESGVEILTLC